MIKQFEISNPAPSQMVTHDPVLENVNMQNTQVDLGLKPNGLTISDMREMGKLAEPIDDIDKIGLARQESARLADSLQKASRDANKAYKQIYGKSFKQKK